MRNTSSTFIHNIRQQAERAACEARAQSLLAEANALMERAQKHLAAGELMAAKACQRAATSALREIARVPGRDAA